jgi:hypothetical protein
VSKPVRYKMRRQFGKQTPGRSSAGKWKGKEKWSHVRPRCRRRWPGVAKRPVLYYSLRPCARTPILVRLILVLAGWSPPPTLALNLHLSPATFAPVDGFLAVVQCFFGSTPFVSSAWSRSFRPPRSELVYRPRALRSNFGAPLCYVSINSANWS